MTSRTGASGARATMACLVAGITASGVAGTHVDPCLVAEM